MSSLSIPNFKLDKLAFSANFHASASVASLSHILLHNYVKSNSTSVLFLLRAFGSGNNSFYMTVSFLSIKLLKELS